jgi:hypothetical protein
VADRNRPQRHVWRARIVLLTADQVGTAGIERQTGKDKTCVWRWQERFMLEGVDGLLPDKTRRSGKPPLATAVIERAVALTDSGRPGEATHWTAAAMAKSVGISVSSVQRIWRAHGLQHHRVHLFELSNDPAFTAKLRDIVGLYVDPPAHAVVLSVYEKSQIQALDRTHALRLSSGPLRARVPRGSLLRLRGRGAFSTARGTAPKETSPTSLACQRRCAHLQRCGDDERQPVGDLLVGKGHIHDRQPVLQHP